MKIDKNDTKLSKLVKMTQNRQNWQKMTQKRQNWPYRHNIVKIGQNRHNFQNWEKCHKKVKIGLIDTKLSKLTGSTNKNLKNRQS